MMIENNKSKEVEVNVKKKSFDKTILYKMKGFSSSSYYIF